MYIQVLAVSLSLVTVSTTSRTHDKPNDVSEGDVRPTGKSLYI